MAALVLVVGCTTQANPDDAARLEPAPSIEPAPAPIPPPDLTPATMAAAAAGSGLSAGPPAEYEQPERAHAKLSHGGATVVAHAHMIPQPEFGDITQLQVRIEFAALPGDAFGLNYVGGGGDDNCDELTPAVQEIALLDDGRWLVDAQLACRAGEDYFSARNDHTLLLVDPKRPHAEVLWTGVDTGSNSMGVCVSSSVAEFVVDAGVLRITNTEITTLDREAAERLPAAAEGCKPKRERSSELARIELVRAP